MNNNINNKKKKIFQCGNCGKSGHIYKNCNEPITSFGIIYIYINFNEKTLYDEIIHKMTSTNVNIKSYLNKNISIINTNGIYYDGDINMEIFCSYLNKIKFLMVRRKHSLGYIEFLRGRYNLNDNDSIAYLFKQMTNEEIKKLKDNTFDELWFDLWGNNNNTHKYNTDIKILNEKFLILKNKEEFNLDYFIKNIQPKFDECEWGFPKGRRNNQETNLQCALREFREETGFTDGDFVLLNKIKPIDEKLIGTNGLNYKHLYYTAICNSSNEPYINMEHIAKSNEIGDMGWFTYNEALKLIRPYHIDRRNILMQLYMYFINSIIDIIKNIKNTSEY